MVGLREKNLKIKDLERAQNAILRLVLYIMYFIKEPFC